MNTLTLKQLKNIEAAIASEKLRYDRQFERCQKLELKQGSARRIEEEWATLREIEAEIENLSTLKDRAYEKFKQLSDSRYRAIMVGYYLNGLTLDQIADLIGNHRNTIFSLHRKAVKEFEELCNIS